MTEVLPTSVSRRRGRRLERAAGARPARFDRRGSVLILVVALLVLMALLGTAYISTTRVDRVTSAQHTRNIQIDMLVEGVVNQVASTIQSDLYDTASGTTTFHPPDANANYTTNYDPYDSYGFTTPYDVRGGSKTVGTSNAVAHDLFISQRIPWTQDPLTPFGLANPPAWRGLSYPVQQSTGTLPGQNWRFSSPDGTNVLDLSMPFAPSSGANVGNNGALPQNFTAKPWFIPTTKEFPTGSGKFYPALTPYVRDLNPPGSPIVGPTFIAADADGDGVADSGLVKLPVGTIDGVTYYAAIRIVDNNSALNINTAWANMEFDGSGGSTTTAGQPYPGRYYTPASAGLAELLRTTNLQATNVGLKGAEFGALAQYWFNGPQLPPGVQGSAVGTPHYDDGAAIVRPVTGQAIVQYQSLQDSLTQLLGVRPTNPGTVTGGGGAPAVTRAQGFSISDSMALAYHNGLLNPDASPSPLESIINALNNPQDSFYQGAPNYGSSTNRAKWSAYALSTTGIDNWYGTNFDYAGEVSNNPASFKQRRPITVASNPVSWQAPYHVLDNYALNAGMPAYTVVAGQPIAPTKTSINQAPFDELWRAFFNVMTENVAIPQPFLNNGTIYRGSPFDLRVLYTAANNPTLIRPGTLTPDLDPPTFNDPYLGTTFTEYAPTTPATSNQPTRNTGSPLNPLADMAAAPGPPAPTDYHPSRMFRSPMRAVPDPAVAGATPGFNNATPRLNAQQTMLLRSALAAVNAQDLRDSDDDVTARRILLEPTTGGTAGSGGPGAPTPAEAIVYGGERQPFITEIYADTEDQNVPAGANGPNQYGYVCVELYNPYDKDILLKNWKLVAIDRRSQAATAGPSAGILPPYSNAGLTRPLTPGAVPPAMPYNLVLEQSTLIAEFDTAYDTTEADVLVPPGSAPVGPAAPLVVPARGYLLLENYYDPAAYGAPTPPLTPPLAGFAQYRPPVTGLPLTGSLTNAPMAANGGTDRSDVANPPYPNFRPSARPANLPRVNVACVPGLSGATDPAWGAATPEWNVPVRSVINRELVLLRPRRADGRYSWGIFPALQLPNNATLPALAYDERPNVTAVVVPEPPDPPLPPVAGANEVPYSHLRDLVPVDSFDFTGLQLPQPPAGVPVDEPLGRPATAGAPPGSTRTVAEAWHYSRQNVEPQTAVAFDMPSDWKFVYPGRYRALSPTAAGSTITDSLTNLVGDPLPRQQGTQYLGWNVPGSAGAAGPGGWQPVPTLAATESWFTFGMDINGGTPAGNQNLHASYPRTFKVPLAYVNFSRETTAGLVTTDLGRNTVGETPLSIANTNPPPNHYPFGGFARDGDILATPFIGAYTIRYCYNNGPGTNFPVGLAGVAPAQYGSTFTVAEMNAVTADSVFAEDTDIHDDPDPIDEQAPPAGYNDTIEREQLGRFCPVRVLNIDSTQGGAPIRTALNMPDYAPPGAGFANVGYPNPSFAGTAAPGPVPGYGQPGVMVNDFGFDPSYQRAIVGGPLPQPARGCNWEPFWRYHWASDLLDYLAVRTPSDDYLPNYPAQKQWRGLDVTAGFGAAQQEFYRPGDIVSFFNNASPLATVGGVAQPAHEIWVCRTAGSVTTRFPSTPQFQPYFAGRAVKNTSDTDAAYRVDPEIIAAIGNNAAALQNLLKAEHREDNVPLEGLININTADWKVLSTLPLVVDPTTGLPDDNNSPYGVTYRVLNQEMARAIEYYRDVDGNEDPNVFQPHGPFRSLEELNRVVDTRPPAPQIPAVMNYPNAQGAQPGFQNMYGLLPLANNIPVAANSEANDSLGDLSPVDVGGAQVPDGVKNDYEERFLQLNRISNMITTRSDSFTCYILVQGWRDAETNNAQLVVQRRVGYLMDRSRITPATPDMLTKQPFPNN